MNEEVEVVERESAGCISGIALGLGFFAIAVLVIASTKSAPVKEPAELWAQHFQASTAPSGYEFTGAAVLSEDCTLISLRRIGAEEALVSTGESAPEEDEELEKVDWAALEERERDTLPDELLFIFYLRESSEKMLETYFRNLSRRDLDELEGKGGTVIVESGELDWKGYRTNYVRQREFQRNEGEPEFVDSLRVNLSIGQSCVLVAIWPASYPSGVEVVEALLSEVEPLAATDS